MFNFKRPCRRCNKLFRPCGKKNIYCPKCVKKAFKNRKKSTGRGDI
jgi:hypothetical protein